MSTTGHFESRIATINAIVQTAIDAKRIAGLAVGIVKQREIAYAAGFGVRSLGQSDKVTERSVFHAASVSKVFVATALMQLVERGAIDLSAPVTRYLPYFELADARYADITVKQMLTHTSGMPDFERLEDYAWDKPEFDDGALERFVRGARSLTLKSAPGETCAYSNIAFNILGDVIAKASGQSFEDYTKTHVLAPSGMRDSSFFHPEIDRALATSGHFGDQPDGSGTIATPCPMYPYSRQHAPSSTLQTNVLDLCQFAVMNLNRGRAGSQLVLQQNSFYALWQPYVQTSSATFQGLGWIIANHYGVPSVFHPGGDIGYGSILLIFPQHDSAVVILSNTDPGVFDIYGLVEQALFAATDGG
jgi:CubicO group peptidase (beta-lactamase class C family)